MPSCVFNFFILMFSYTSLNILNILLISLCLSSFCTALFRTPIHVPSCCAFPSIECTTTPQFHYSFFFSVLHSGHKISLLSHSSTLSSIAFFLPYFIHCTLVISPLLASSSLQFHASWQRLHHIFFYLSSKEKLLSSIFMGLNSLAFTYSILYIGYYCLLYDLSPFK